MPQYIADLYGFPLRFVSEDKFRSVLIIELEKDEDAEKFLERGVLVMQVVEAAYNPDPS
jgi:tRNA (guanine10-N2)-methyltransferase